MDKQLHASAVGGNGEMGNDKINTSISIDKDLWKEFNIVVLMKEGNKKNSKVLEDLMRNYIKKNKGGI